MKEILIYLLFILAGHMATAQNNFVGMAKYKMTVEGSNSPVTDSMLVIFNKEKVKVILYLPDVKIAGRVAEKIFIDDFAAKKSMTLNIEDKSYKIDTLNSGRRFDFVNTNGIAGCNNLLCITYKADSNKLDRSQVAGAYCLASIDHRNESITNYFFLGIQPVIVDNRVVMDFIVSRPDGVKQRIYIYDIQKLENADSYFDLEGYKQLTQTM